MIARPEKPSEIAAVARQLHSSDMLIPPTGEAALGGSVLTHFIMMKSPADQEIGCVLEHVLGLAEVVQVIVVSANEAAVAPLAAACITVNVWVFAPVGVPR